MKKVESIADIPEVMAYLKRVNAEVRSMRGAAIQERDGKYFRDLATIKFSKEGEIKCSTAEHSPSDAEVAAIKSAILSTEWPEIQPLVDIINPPDLIKNADPEDVFKFRGIDGKITMVQVLINKPDGSKNYVPYTYWDDDKWRPCEPDAGLPLYNADRIRDNTTVFIHEGAKAARFCQQLVDQETTHSKKAFTEHPWSMELCGAAHLGWVGGALSPYRTEWSMLAKAGVKRAYIVADNDDAGRSAVPTISQLIRIPAFTIQFTDEFPRSFDMADKFPEHMFSDTENGRFYIGPTFRECTHPATWATDLVASPTGKGRPISVLRPAFRNEWAYVEEADFFVHRTMPEIVRQDTILNKMLAPFSHVADTTRLIVKEYQGRSTRVCYRPDVDGLLVTSQGSSAINLHVPTTITGQEGSAKPFLEFIDYLIVNPKERKEVLRWVATLIARPDVRMGYGVLLISEKQGVGKTTLALILAKLVGEQNVSWPTEKAITSEFNDWAAQKRLAVVSEIYSGSSWKAYNMLKAIITDPTVTVNQKYMRPYQVENWCHVFASSNSMRALKMENDDRRWLYPEVTEVAWSGQKFREFRKWLDGGGIKIIKHWAKNEFSDYVKPSEKAPMTDRKKELIEGSRSEAQTEAVAVAERIRDESQPMCLLMKDVVNWCRLQAQGKVFDTDYELRRSMTETGVFAWPQRIKVAGRLQYVIINEALRDIAQRTEEESRTAAIRSHVVKCSDILEEGM